MQNSKVIYSLRIFLKLKELGYNTDEVSYMFTENYSINVNNKIIK